jgi:polyhydroxyalkanoate synthesis regulator phasin
MTNPLDLAVTVIIDSAIRSLSERTDPLITRVNEGGTLTTAETKQILHDLFKLAKVMKASAEAITLASDKIGEQEKEIEILRALLGLGEPKKAAN